MGGEFADFRPRSFDDLLEEQKAHIKALFRKNPMGFQPGEYRMARTPKSRDLWTMVLLVCQDGLDYWTVETVTGEFQFVAKVEDIGLDTFNSMEVIAWASRISGPSRTT